MKNSFIHMLNDFNLDEKEGLIYKICLQYGVQSAGLIAHNTGIKRPSVYVILDRLIEKGFISEEPGEATKLFKATSPRNVLTLLKNQELAFEKQVSQWEQIIPELEAIQKKEFQAPKVKFFRGEQSMTRMYEDSLKSPVWRGIVDLNNVAKNFEEYLWKIAETLSKNKEDARDIVVDCALAREYKARADGHSLKVKLISPTEPIMSDTIILDNKFYLVSFAEHEMLTLEVESEAITRSQLLMFDALWDRL